MDNKKIGAFLRDLRKEHNLTQEELGEKLGATNKTISRWETGTYMPPVDILLQMSKLYDVSVNEILSGERLATADYQPKAEENIVTTLECSIKDKRGKKIAIICCSVVLAMVFAVMVLYLSLNSLFPQYTAQFIEGVYEYRGEPLELVNGAVAETIELTFKEIDKKNFNDAGRTNVIKNRANGKTYSLNLSIKLQDGNVVDYAFDYYAGGGNNLYDLEILGTLNDLIPVRYMRFYCNSNEYNVTRNIELYFDIEGYEEIGGANHGIVLKLRDDKQDILW